jgi:hypothetical protein
MFRNTLIFAVIFIAPIVFLSDYFFPRLSLIATQEIGVNDVWQQNYPFRKIYSESLHQGLLPVWTDKIAGGFPLLAEGQTGFFYLPNLVLNFLFPAPLAFNLGYAVSFIICSLGMYFFLRKAGISRLSSLGFSVAYAYGGFFITHMSHYNLFQAAALTPWILYSAMLIFSDNRFGMILFAFILSQQIFTGHLQMVLVSAVALAVMSAGLYLPGKIKIRHLARIGLAGLFGILLSSAQIIPTYELNTLSTRSKGISFNEIISYKYPLKFLLTLILPFAFGNPQLGTFAHFRENGGALFWETSAYLGLLPVLGAILAVFLPVKKAFKIIGLTIIGVSLILMIGPQSPFYIILTFPPFSFFRFPMRFLAVFTLGICLLAAFSNDYLLGKIRNAGLKKYLSGGIFVIIILNVFIVWRNYHGSVPYSEFLAPPESVKLLTDGPGNKIISLASQVNLYHEFFDKNSGRVGRMMDLRNYLPANLYTIYNLDSMEVYTSQQSKRSVYYRGLFGETNTVSATSSSIFSDVSLRLLAIKGVNRIISPYRLESENKNLKLLSENKLPETYDNLPANYYIYRLDNSLKKLSLLDDAKQISTFDEFYKTVSLVDFDYQKTALVETDLGSMERQTPLKYEISDQIFTDSSVKAKVKTSRDSILVSTVNYYPGWKAKIDGQNRKVFPVDVLNLGLLIPEGVHSIELYFDPLSYRAGYIISLAGYTLLFLNLFFILRRHK